MAWPAAEHGVKGDDALASKKAVDPVIGYVLGEYLARPGPPGIARVVQRRSQCDLALLVPSGADGRARADGRSGAGRVGRPGHDGWVSRTEHVQCLQARRVVGPARPAGIRQRTAQFPVVEVLGVSDGEDANIIARIVDDLIAEVGCHGQAVEDECLDILKDVAPSER